MEIKVSQFASFLNKFFEDLFKCSQILLSKMKKRRISWLIVLNLFLNLKLQHMHQQLSPKFKSNQNIGYINKMVISNEL